MGRRLVRISYQLLETVLVTDREHHVRVAAGLPEGVKLRGGTWVHNDLVLTFEHPDWPEGSGEMPITITQLEG